MNSNQKDVIRKLRANGQSYSQIANSLDISENTVKTFCRRNHLQKADLKILRNAKQDFAISVVCTQCGKLLKQSVKRKPKRFCSDKCRLAWWNSHRDEVKQKKIRTLVCTACGTEFKSYDAQRKYCSHQCYIKDRFGGDRYDVETDGT